MKLLSLILEDIDWDLWEKYDEYKTNYLNDFLLNNNETYTKQVSLRKINPTLLKSIWEYYIRFKDVRNIKGLNQIEGIMTVNVLSLEIFSVLAGHSSVDPQDDIEEQWDEYVNEYINKSLNDVPNLKQYLDKRIENDFGSSFYDNDFYEVAETSPEELKKYIYDDVLLDQFYSYYMIDEKSGNDILSDYGREPLMKLLDELRSTDDVGKKVVTLDKMLNVTHQRFDLASLFVQGGADALSNISGYYHDSDYSWNQKSVISNPEINELSLLKIFKSII